MRHYLVKGPATATLKGALEEFEGLYSSNLEEVVVSDRFGSGGSPRRDSSGNRSTYLNLFYDHLLPESLQPIKLELQKLLDRLCSENLWSFEIEKALFKSLLQFYFERLKAGIDSTPKIDLIKRVFSSIVADLNSPKSKIKGYRPRPGVNHPIYDSLIGADPMLGHVRERIKANVSSVASTSEIFPLQDEEAMCGQLTDTVENIKLRRRVGHLEASLVASSPRLGAESSMPLPLSSVASSRKRGSSRRSGDKSDEASDLHLEQMKVRNWQSRLELQLVSSHVKLINQQSESRVARLAEAMGKAYRSSAVELGGIAQLFANERNFHMLGVRQFSNLQARFEEIPAYQAACLPEEVVLRERFDDALSQREEAEALAEQTFLDLCAGGGAVDPLARARAQKGVIEARNELLQLQVLEARRRLAVLTGKGYVEQADAPERLATKLDEGGDLSKVFQLAEEVEEAAQEQAFIAKADQLYQSTDLYMARRVRLDSALRELDEKRAQHIRASYRFLIVPDPELNERVSQILAGPDRVQQLRALEAKRGEINQLEDNILRKHEELQGYQKAPIKQPAQQSADQQPGLQLEASARGVCKMQLQCMQRRRDLKEQQLLEEVSTLLAEHDANTLKNEVIEKMIKSVGSKKVVPGKHQQVMASFQESRRLILEKITTSFMNHRKGVMTPAGQAPAPAGQAPAPADEQLMIHLASWLNKLATLVGYAQESLDNYKKHIGHKKSTWSWNHRHGDTGMKRAEEQTAKMLHGEGRNELHTLPRLIHSFIAKIAAVDVDIWDREALQKAFSSAIEEVLKPILRNNLESKGGRTNNHSWKTYELRFLKAVEDVQKNYKYALPQSIKQVRAVAKFDLQIEQFKSHGWKRQALFVAKELVDTLDRPAEEPGPEEVHQIPEAHVQGGPEGANMPQPNVPPRTYKLKIWAKWARNRGIESPVVAPVDIAKRVQENTPGVSPVA